MAQDVIMGRQAIFDRNNRVVAYELLFRALDQTEQKEPSCSGQSMTANVLIRSLLDIGLERMAGELTVYVNIDEPMLIDHHQLLTLLPPERMAIEVLESVPANEQTIAAIHHLKAAGFTILLDDVVDAVAVEAFIPYVDIIKVDIRETDDLPVLVDALKGQGVKLLAEKVETREEAALTRDMGFDLFQGYFFCRPDIIEGRPVPESKVAVLRALQQVLMAEELEDIHGVFKQDVGLSYRLLRYINSAAFGLRTEVVSIEQAMSLLGMIRIRQWLTLLSLSALGSEKPGELIRTALYRGHFLENMARLLGEKETGDDFLLGLFSVLDALLDQPMDKVLRGLPLPLEVQSALIVGLGPMKAKLDFVRSMEGADWDAVHHWCTRFKLKTNDITRIQQDALCWSEEYFSILS